MRISWAGPLFVVLVAFAGRALAQYDAPIEAFLVNASKACTWVEGDTNVVMLEGPVTIKADKHLMTAQQAVIWVTPIDRAALDQDRVEVSLIGDAKLVLPNGSTRSGPRLYVDARVRGTLRVTAPRVGGDRSNTELYQLASGIRPTLLKPGQPSGHWIVEEQAPLPATLPATQPAQQRTLQPVTIYTDQFETTLTPEGKVAAILSGSVSVLQKSAQGDTLELLADRAVVFTPFPSLHNIPPAERIKTIEQAVTGVYLEGDVRIIRTPRNTNEDSEQRLTANRAFYDFTTDRAILTDVVLHTTDPNLHIPIVVRARTMHQLSRTPRHTEFLAEDVRLSSSSFHTPTYSIGASSAYIRQTETDNAFSGARTTFSARNTSLKVGNVPLFYFPFLGGTVPERTALRGLGVVSSSQTGLGITTEWGLFETFGRLPPDDLDASYRLDYFSDRGPAAGFDAQYTGGFIEERTLEPWSFSGDLTSYALLDDGTDELGRSRLDIDHEDDFRGRFYWRHQHFFPGDWQVQVTGGYISDPTFLEEWFTRDFMTSQPLDTSLYLKRQRDSEAITFLASFQPNDFVTVAELYQEQFEIERLPEIGYHRIGDSILDDRFTFFSYNTLSALRFKPSDADLTEDLGFRGNLSPGIPALGLPYDLNRSSVTAGIEDDLTYRGDFRQELDWPMSVGKFRVVPYVIGRYTDYSQAVDGEALGRLYMGGGVRASTAFWKVDDTVESDLLDLHRLRHVIEPTFNVYAGVQSQDRADVFIYDEPIDAITDITAMQWKLLQRWQTKRGGPGNWRSVDFLTLNVAWNYFFSQPPEIELNPTDFRGLFFVSLPEASIARNSVNLDANWRVSDSVALVSDAQFNSDGGDLAVASIGLSVNHAPRLNYYVGLRHIDEINLEDVEFNDRGEPIVLGRRFLFDSQDLILFAINYALTPKYTVDFAYSYDAAQNRTVRSIVGLTRQFDRLFVSASIRTDRIEDETAIMFNLWPAELRPLPATRGLQSYFQN